MIVVTGACGFIGSCLVSRLNQDNFNTIVAVDEFSKEKKLKNLSSKRILHQVHREQFFEWLNKWQEEVEFIFHIGARTDTTEKNVEIFSTLNLEYSKEVWNACCRYQIPLIYASSAATYGNGTKGFDDEIIPEQFEPLNPYGISKNNFDKWVLLQKITPFFWAGLKFFNVYGPNEYHKGRMASVIFHAYHEIKKNGYLKLFKSHNPDYKDGYQARDFIYVKDILEVCMYFMVNRKNSGIYNLGTGQAKTFLDLADSLFSVMNIKKDVRFIDTPDDIRDNYQYFTQAKMNKLRSVSYTNPFIPLQEGINDYVTNYLNNEKYY